MSPSKDTVAKALAPAPPSSTAAVVAIAPPAAAKEPPFLVHFAAGTFGGIFGLTLCYPLDTVKVRIQTRPAGTYTGIAQCMGTIARTEGVSALYRGLMSPVLGYGLIKATAFASYNQAKQWNQQAKGAHSLSLGEMTLCGAFAGFCQTFVRAPVEQIKVVMQARNKPGSTQAPYRGTWHCLTHVLATEGVRAGLYRSLVPTLSREIPQYAIYYPAYELMVSWFCKPGQKSSDLPAAQVAMAGGVAGVAQWVPTYSLDVIKSKVSAAPPGTYAGLLDCARKSLAAEGPSVFWRGISAAVVRAFPLHGAVFLGYELSMKMLRKEE